GGAQGLLFGGGDDPRHGLHGLHGVLSDAGLAGEHDCVRAVEDGVSHVRSLSPRGARVVDHAFEHLRGDDDRFGFVPAPFNGAFLHHGHIFEGEFDTEAAAGDHDAVESLDDVLKPLHRPRFFDLGDEGDVHADLVHDPVDVFRVGGAAHKRERHHVDALLQGPAQVPFVFFGQRGDRNRHPGQVEPFVVGYRAADDDAGVDIRAGAFDAFQNNATVVDEDAVARTDITRESFICGGDPVAVPGYIVDGDGELVTGAEGHGSVDERPETDLRPLQVGENTDITS